MTSGSGGGADVLASSAVEASAMEPTPALNALLDRLAAIDEVPLDDRPALFERANEVLVAALADLEEG